MSSLDRDLSAQERERRACLRHHVCVPCTVLESRTNIGIFWSHDLGVGGAMMTGGDIFEPGRRLNLILHFPWTHSVSVAATVVGRDPEAAPSPGLALRFDHDVFGSRLSLERVLQLREVPRDDEVPLQALIMTMDRDLRVELERDVLSVDARPVLARRPLDAIWRLTSSAMLVRSAFVDSRLLGSRTLEWFAFLGQAFPHITRVLVQGIPLQRHPSSLLVNGAIDAFLTVPWSRAYLSDIIHGDRRSVAESPAERGERSSMTIGLDAIFGN